MPDDAVGRIYQTDDLDDSIQDIAVETYENIVSTSERDVDSPVVHSDSDISEYIDTDTSDRDPLRTGQLAYLVSQIIGQLSGNVDISRITGEVSDPREQRGESPDHQATVLVHRRNRRNFEDIGVFTVENGKKFFGESFGDSAVMFELLRRGDVEPEFVATDVAFDSEGNGWGASPTPDHEITIMSTDHKNRVDFGTVADPRRSFGETWGDVSEMMSGLGEDEYVHEHSAGGVAWQIVLGL
jgi:hypothetical protein